MSRIITMAKLQNRTIEELQALYRKTSQELTRSPRGSAARRNALATLENIARAMTMRRTQRPTLPPRL
jgi:hypothetical protein